MKHGVLSRDESAVGVALPPGDYVVRIHAVNTAPQRYRHKDGTVTEDLTRFSMTTKRVTVE